MCTNLQNGVIKVCKTTKVNLLFIWTTYICVPIHVLKLNLCLLIIFKAV